jgi:hypothetical protein
MSPITHFFNRLLPSMPAVEFEALRPHLEIVELIRESVLLDGGISLTDAIVRLEGKSPNVTRLRSLSWSAVDHRRLPGVSI